MADDRQLSAAFALLCWHFCEQTGSICFRRRRSRDQVDQTLARAPV